MRHAWNRMSSWLLPSLLLVACGPSQEPVEDTGASEVGTSAQSVLYPPPAPSSGNIVDSTAFLGPVGLNSFVQTSFTTNPQYLSFSFKVAAGAQVALEVTHGGSSMGLDTGLFIYGPKNANGSYGTTLRAQDDDAGYGQLSKVTGLTLAQGGEYLAVVSTGTGAGKQFRLVLGCLNSACAEPSLFTACDLDVATRIEVCDESVVETQGLTPAQALPQCTDAQDAHAAFVENCFVSSGAKPWCADGESAFTTKMWPVCKDFYYRYYGAGPLPLTQLPLSSTLQAAQAAGHTHCKTGENWCDESLWALNVPSVAGTTPVSLDRVAEGAFASIPALSANQNLQFERQPDLTYAEFGSHVQQFFPELVAALPGALGNGTEAAQVARFYASEPVAPGAKDYHSVYVVYFPVSHQTAVFWLIRHEI
ncbi:hypothetical protein D7Y13_24090 [Corallococcus praedator]|uniref:Uncharacterized protein n=2 Tax=Myxococcaceae TaxID=31 RepID=A0ABX9QD37_9BACT|nr:hypothetical protein D7X74_04525 [Corallococcus sp. CA047B]RKH25382.1 hypothetical protein D7X75_30170 [Corallococcus sp. CA031C]RKI02635.1 hypothetical protein D7Y13_24090 [Corallococcus praedator]